MLRIIFPACVKVGVKHTEWSILKHTSFRLRLFGSIWDLMSSWEIQDENSWGSGLEDTRVCLPTVQGPSGADWWPGYWVNLGSQGMFLLLIARDFWCYLVEIFQTFIYLWDETESILWNSLISYLTITSVNWATVKFSEWLDCLTRKMLPYRRLTGLLGSDRTFWNHVVVRVLKKILLLDSTVATHLSFLGNSVAKISIFIS